MRRGALTRWADLAEGIRHLQAEGGTAPGLDADREAAALLAGVQGGVLLLMITGAPTSLEVAPDMGIARLRAAGRQAH
ncbi:hypothetical protein ABZ802_32735 [Streptomyces sp. NPDC047737]|uniref:hypothetical protein n=1 Tax=Streptomyces sp. NPDC047737 TaxID=3155740 RepID=UPI0033FFC91F